MAKLAGAAGGGAAPLNISSQMAGGTAALRKHKRQSSSGPPPIGTRSGRSRSVSVAPADGGAQSQALTLFERYSLNYDTTEGIDLNGFLLFAETAGLLPSAAAETEGVAFPLSRADGILVFSQAKPPKRDTLTLRSFQDAAGKLAARAGDTGSGALTYEGLLETVTQVLVVSDAQYAAAAAYGEGEAGAAEYDYAASGYEGYSYGEAEEGGAAAEEGGYGGYAAYEAAGGAIAEAEEGEEEEEEEKEEEVEEVEEEYAAPAPDGVADAAEDAGGMGYVAPAASAGSRAEARLKRLSTVAPNQLQYAAAMAMAAASATEPALEAAAANPFSKQNYYGGAAAADEAPPPAPPALVAPAVVRQNSKKGKKARPPPPTAAVPSPRGYQRKQVQQVQQGFAAEAASQMAESAAAAEAAEEQRVAAERAAVAEAARLAAEAEAAQAVAEAAAAADEERKLERQLAAEQDIRDRAAVKAAEQEARGAAEAAQNVKLAAAFAKKQADEELSKQRDAEASKAWEEVARNAKEAERAVERERRAEPNRCARIIQRAARMVICRARVERMFATEYERFSALLDAEGLTLVHHPRSKADPRAELITREKRKGVACLTWGGRVGGAGGGDRGLEYRGGVQGVKHKATTRIGGSVIRLADVVQVSPPARQTAPFLRRSPPFPLPPSPPPRP